jgi:hypothetical protein
MSWQRRSSRFTTFRRSVPRRTTWWRYDEAIGTY